MRQFFKNFFLPVLFSMLTLGFFSACDDKSEDDYFGDDFRVSATELNFGSDGGTQSLTVLCSGKPTVVSLSSMTTDWISVSEPVVSNSAGNIFRIEFSVKANPTENERTTAFMLTAGNGGAEITVKQAAGEIQTPEEPVVPGEPQMGSTAMEIAARMYAGINIGNTMETPDREGAWNCPVVNRDYIKGLKALGFNAVRVPCAWDSHVSNASSNIINEAWLDRVSEVVGWIVAEDMYAVLNIHWDGGWLENSCANGYDEKINQKQHDYWTQIANKLNKYDERLLLAAMNEPNVGDGSSKKKASIEAIMKYQQTMLDAVRATGGNNASRVLVMQGPNTDIDVTLEGQYDLPKDVIADRLMIETHFYGPYQFNMMEKDESWGKTFWYWGKENHVAGSDRNSTWGEEDYVADQFQKMKKRFIDKGIPGITGEYAVCFNRENTAGIDKDKWRASVKLWNKVVTRESKKAGMVPFFWETGGDINRTTGNILSNLQLDGVFEGAADGKYPF
ncbi:MAG: cellulase family glycosylhydrolase [Muribaculum sp.]|nr:cellulase family glycosylhydrolase [Muribaculum sp.]